MNYIPNATADLIAKARNLHEGIPMGDGERDLCQACSPERMPCEVIQLADALEAATRVPVQGESNDDYELVDVVLTTADIEELSHLLVQLSPATQKNSGATMRRLMQEMNIKEVAQ